jgi:CBS domain containing-hemolysin-like protein
MLTNEYSRYPVYDKEKDNIIGILHIKDVLVEYLRGKQRQKIKSFVSTPIFVPQHKSISDLMKEFQDKRMHMAIVVNDHGEVVGLVTLEDLLEELVGEIIDESDVTKTIIKRVDKDTVLLHGMTTLKDLKQFIHLNLSGNKNDTINAIILKRLGRIPKEGDEFTIEGNEITVAEANPKQVVKLKLKRTYKA